MSFVAEPSMEEVVAAITTLYHGQDPKQKEAASRWLDELQRSVAAWKAADSLLHAKVSLESCYFAAQTMRRKMGHLMRLAEKKLRDKPEIWRT